jgi:hypothetical protein
VILEQEEKAFIGFSALTAQLWKKIYILFFAILPAYCQENDEDLTKTFAKWICKHWALELFC